MSDPKWYAALGSNPCCHLLDDGHPCGAEAVIVYPESNLYLCVAHMAQDDGELQELRLKVQIRRLNRMLYQPNR